MSVEEFRNYYENNHAALIMKLNPLPGYTRHYVESEPQMRNADMIDCDVVTEMTFPDEAAANAWFEAFASPEVSLQIAADEEKFLDTSTLRVFRTHSVTTGD